MLGVQQKLSGCTSTAIRLIDVENMTAFAPKMLNTAHSGYGSNEYQRLHQPGSEYACSNQGKQSFHSLRRQTHCRVSSSKSGYLHYHEERKKERREKGRKEERTKSNRSPCMPFVVSKSSMQKQIKFSPWFKILQYNSKHSIICHALRLITLDQAQKQT